MCLRSGETGRTIHCYATSFEVDSDSGTGMNPAPAASVGMRESYYELVARFHTQNDIATNQRGNRFRAITFPANLTRTSSFPERSLPSLEGRLICARVPNLKETTCRCRNLQPSASESICGLGGVGVLVSRTCCLHCLGSSTGQDFGEALLLGLVTKFCSWKNCYEVARVCLSGSTRD